MNTVIKIIEPLGIEQKYKGKQIIPLDYTDFPPSSCIRRIGVNEWCSITRCTNEFIVSDFGMMLFTSIYGFEIYHPIVYPNWSPCYKSE